MAINVSRAITIVLAMAQNAVILATCRREHCATLFQLPSVVTAQAPNSTLPHPDHHISTYASAAADTTSPEN